MKNDIKIIKGLSDLIKILDNHDDGFYIYRGEPSTAYKLKPKLGRYTHDLFEWPDSERTLIHNFKRKSLPYLTTKPKTEIQWLALAQHYGLATRLLDWTENLLVLCFFSVRQFVEYLDSILYALRADEYEFIEDDNSLFIMVWLFFMSQFIYLLELQHRKVYFLCPQIQQLNSNQSI